MTTQSYRGTGHQLNSEARSMIIAKCNLEEAYHDLTKAGITTEVLDIRTEIHNIIKRLDRIVVSSDKGLKC